MKPEFTVPESNDQLGIYSHVLDTKRIKDIIGTMDIEMLNPVKSKLIPLYHASAESVAKTLENFLNISNPSKSSSVARPQSGGGGSPVAVHRVQVQALQPMPFLAHSQKWWQIREVMVSF